MAGLRSFDAFAKPVDGLRNKSACGGVITVIASSFAILLFLSQVAIYYQLETRQHFELARSHTTNVLPDAIEDMNKKNRPGRIVQQDRAKDPNNIKLTIHVSFPYVKCTNLDLVMDGATGENLDLIHGRNAIVKRPPTKKEIETMKKSLNDDESKKINAMTGCTYQGSVYVPRVGGSFGITIAQSIWHQAHTIMDFLMNTNAYNDRRNLQHNVTHYIHNIEFGTAFPHLPHPLRSKTIVFNFPIPTSENQKDHSVVKHFSSVGLSSNTIKLVHVQYKRFARSLKNMYQMSLAEHVVSPTYLAQKGSNMLPGMNIVYDFTPFSVYHSETRENLFLFLGSLVSIVGGVFVTVGLVSSCLISAVYVGKKVD